MIDEKVKFDRRDTGQTEKYLRCGEKATLSNRN
jgi:hypothetical protein